MMKTELLFPTQLWQDTFDLDLDEIRAFAYHVKDEDPKGRVASNDGGWQSNDFRPPYIDQTPLASFHQRLQHMAYAVAEDFGCRDFRCLLYTSTRPRDRQKSRMPAYA